jgi:hypothetical protein
MPKKRVPKENQNVSFHKKQDIFSYVLAAVFTFLLLSFTISKISNEDDIFWHLSTGKYIVENKIIPSTDIFSFSTLNQQWIPFEWGWDVMNYLIYSDAGFIGVTALNTILFISFFLIIFSTARRFEVSYTIIFLLLIALLFGIFERIIPRPQAFSYLCFVILISIILRNKYFDRSKIRPFYILPLFFLVWANIHMGVLAGIIIFGLFVATEFIARIKPDKFSSEFSKPLTKIQLKKVTFIFVLSIAALLVNPHGIHTYIYVYNHLTMKHIGAVNEWITPFDGRFRSQFYVIIYIIFLISGFVILFYCYRKKDLFGVLLFLIFGINSVRAIRYTVDFLAIIIIYFILALNFFITNSKNINLKSFFVSSRIPKIIISAICVFIIISLPDDKLYHSYLKYPRFVGTGIDSTFFPVRLFDFMKENKIAEIGEKPFNSYECGGFFTWNFPGKLEFIDSRAVNEFIMNDYNTIFSKLPGYEKKINSYNFDYAICTEKDMVPAPQFMQEFIISYFSSKPDEWKLVYWDDRSLLFLKNLSKFRDIINKCEYKYISPYNFIYQKAVIEKGIKENSGEVVGEINRNFEQEPGGYYINYIIKLYGNRFK